MMSYRFKRRAFLTGLSGGIGLKIMLRNMESSAQTSGKHPGRLLVTHWPVGIVAGANNALWTPTAGSVGGSPGLKPFADAGLGADMTVFRGISTPTSLNGGGSHEGGTVVLVTGVGCGGTRTNRTEGDDGYAAGPSFEQILLKNVATLKPPGGGNGFANSIADSRTDFGEVSTKCLSYSNDTASVTKYAGGTGTEHMPLKPVLSPLSQYRALFSDFVPRAAFDADDERSDVREAPPPAIPAPDALKRLSLRKSVLDYALDELNQIRTMVPSEARNKLNQHYEAVFQMEDKLSNNINAGYPGAGGMGGGPGMGGRGGSGGAGGNPGTGGAGGGPVIVQACRSKPMEPPGIAGTDDPADGSGNNYGSGRGNAEDSPVLAQAGALHLEVLKAAFVCDIIRVGTFQWCPGTNHVGFKGMYPADPAGIYQHHPLSHKTGTANTTQGATPDALAAYPRFLYNIQLWFFEQHAKNLAAWKKEVDGFGQPLLDSTVIPFVTEVRATSHERTDMPAMIIGGKALGFAHNRYVPNGGSINAFWGTIAQAFGQQATAPFANPIAGLWTKPT